MLPIAELRKLDAKKLLQELEKAKSVVFKAKFEVKNGQSKSNHLIKVNRKNLAQIKTVMKEVKPENNQESKENSEA